MTLLLASLCVGGVALVRSVLSYVGFAFVYDGLHRIGYLRHLSALSDDYVDDPEPQREAVRQDVRARLTAVGESFSEWMHPSDAPRTRGGFPKVSNKKADLAGYACVTFGTVLLISAALALVSAIFYAAWHVSLIELMLAVAAIAGGLGAARALSKLLGPRKKYAWALLSIFVAGVLGALGGGVLIRSSLCTASESQGSRWGIGSTLK